MVRKRRKANPALERLTETLAQLPMDSLTRHWLEEDLRDAIEERVAELEADIEYLEEKISAASSALD